MYQRVRSLALFILILAGSMPAVAQDKIWTGAVDSSWHTAGNWSPSGVPGTTQTVGLRGNKKPYPVITTNVTVRSVTINMWWSNPGDQLKIRNNATLTITDDLSIYGSGKLQIINGHVVMNATTSGANNLDLNGATEINITTGSFTAGTVTEDVDVEIIGSVNLGNGDFTVYGDFDISNSDFFNVDNGNVEINGATTINGTFNGDDGTTDFNGDVDIRSGGILNLDTGSINFNSATYVGNNGTANFGSGTATFNDDIDVQSGGYFNVEDADVTVTGSATFSSNGNMSVDTGSITISGNASLSSGGTIDLNNGNLNVGGDASFTSGGTVNAGNATITLEGDFTVQNGSNFASDSSTVVFSGDATQTINTNGNVTFYNVQVDSGAVLNTDGGSTNTITIEGNLTVETGGGVVVEGDDQLDVQGEVSGGGSGNVTSPAPFAVSASATNSTTVVILFNKAMTESAAENTANYSVKNLNTLATLSISSATLNTAGDSKTVTLVVSTITTDVQHEITMNNLTSTDGGNLSSNHKKRFTLLGTVTFYSRTSGNWATNSTWSLTSHSGSAATTNPTAQTGSVIIVGDADVVTVSSSASITSHTSVEVKASSKLVIGTGGTFTTGTKTVTGVGTFQVTTGTLQIGSPLGIATSGATGNIQTTTRTFGTSGSYTYNGSSAQVVGNALPSTVANLKVNNSSGVTLAANLEVTGTLFLTTGSLTVSSGVNLIANTKSISSGNLILKRQITGSNGWRLLSSPIATDYNDFFDAIVTQGYSGAFYSTGSNPGDTLQPNVLYYDETYPGTDNQRWRAPASAGTSVTEGKGLYTYIFGAISGDSRYNNTLPVTLTAQGQEFEGPVDFGVTYTTAADSGWNLVGNPYAATIDWDDTGNWTKTNVDNAIYVWDYSTSQYLTWNGTTGSLTDGLISPFQGFWVKANATTPSLIVDEAAKTTGANFVGKRVTQASEFPAFSVFLADDQKSASTHFMFSEEAKLGKDPRDAYQLLPLSGVGDYLEMSTVLDSGDKLAINHLPRRFGTPISIPLNIERYSEGFASSGALNLQFKNFKNIPTGWHIYLYDQDLGTKTMVQEGSILPFSYQTTSSKTAPNFKQIAQPKITSKVASNATRFTLIIEPGTDAAELPSTYALSQNYPNPFNPRTAINIDLPIQSQVQLTIFDLLGRQVATLENAEVNAGLHTYYWNASGFSSGVYIYRLVTNSEVFIKKMTLIK